MNNTNNKKKDNEIEDLNIKKNKFIEKLFNDKKYAQSIFGGDNATASYSTKNIKELKKEIGEKLFNHFSNLYEFTKNPWTTEKIRKLYNTDSEFNKFVNSLSSDVEQPLYRVMRMPKNQKYEIDDSIDIKNMSSFSKDNNIYKSTLDGIMPSNDKVIILKTNKGMKGVDLKNFSEFQEQKEVLISEGKTYKIKSIKDSTEKTSLGDVSIQLIEIG